jgi:hypothetical protein
MALWDQEAVDLLGPAFIEFKGRRASSASLLSMGGWTAGMGGVMVRPSIDFTREGNDECDPASGRGWVTLQKDGSLTGHTYFHQRR